MNLPEPQAVSFSTLLNDIEKGLIKIPQFQRDFVWSKVKSAKLMDSILKGYPIGTFILWKTKESLRVVRNIGGASLPGTPRGDFIQYVLDGQQRITSLFASIKGLQVPREERLEDFAGMYVDLKAKENEDIVITDQSEKNPSDIISIRDLMYANLSFLFNFPEKYHKKLEEYRQRLQSYSFSTVLIKESDIDIATEIFTRLNVGGQPLSVFEIMVAKTFDASRDFDLAEQYELLTNRLKEVDYETIPDSTVLQLVAAILSKECTKKQILRLNKRRFIEAWPDAVDAIERAVDYFRNAFRIPVSKLLPYNGLLVPFAYFFYHHNKKPTGSKKRYLEDFFWRTSLSGRYSSGVEGKLTQDLRRIDKILNNKLPYYDYPVDISPEFIKENGWFSAGRSYIKAILCILAYKEPKSFIDNSIIRISNDWLKKANSKNYHHFFPRAYLKRKNLDEEDINHIANITIVDDFLNKREIGAQSPSKYMRKFRKENKSLSGTMKRSHLIGLDSFGVWDNDYEKFFSKRLKAFSRELRKRLVYHEIDEIGQPPLADDYEEREIVELY